MLLTGCFATKEVNAAGADGAFYGNGELLGKHIATLCMVGPYFFIMAYILFTITDKVFTPLCTDFETQKMGLDSTQHGETAAFHGDHAASSAENGTTKVAASQSDIEMATLEGVTVQANS